MKNTILKILILGLIFLVPIYAYAQKGTIIGKVTDTETGDALMGANVYIVGTRLGAAAGMNGTYQINDVPAGVYQLKATFMGYVTAVQEVRITEKETVTADFPMTAMVLSGKDITITANRAVERETPIAFNNVTGEQVANKYNTQDLPQLLEAVPGVFATTNGLGESELFVRGFDGDRVQVLINGIPVNDPESQHVYWSNWTGLSSNVRSVQVQRGVGSSLYGSGAFGGSINIETMGLTPKSGVTLRSSVGYYMTKGVDGGANDGKIADGEGSFEEYTPINYNVLARYNSGLMYDGKLNFSLMLERKAGDSYINGTNYDGYSFGLEAQSILGPHKLMLSFISAPQKHNQASAMQDMELLKTLGREYNRNNHEYQENYYNKPIMSLRHEWMISNHQNLVTNLFATMGRGGGKYLRNDNFDVTTGTVGFKPLKESDDLKYMGRHARFIFENTGVVLEGYNPAAKTYFGSNVTSAANIITSSYNHSWRNDSKNNHNQLGLNTYYQHELTPLLSIVVGGETRRWDADHYATSTDFRSNDETRGSQGFVKVFDEVQKRYDYTTTVIHYSGFARFMLKPLEGLNIMVDGQYSNYNFDVNENPIEIFDFALGKFVGKKYRSTADLLDQWGNSKFKDSEYERTFEFFTPKFGINYNLTDKMNMMVNYSMAKKEPDAGDWYNRDKGPGTNQPEGVELTAEKVNTAEFGVGYRETNFVVNANAYYTDFSDKIERVTDFLGNSETINAGKAVHKGVEL
ncbi:TonB-dependent receptor, partial [candidate division KSB1 bacterium]|nr:TonB-dependent receptor [candidate division KSB1 bacterium]